MTSKKQYYATRVIKLSEDTFIQPNHVIKDGLIPAEKIARLLKKGAVAELPTEVRNKPEVDPTGKVELAHLWNFEDELLEAPLEHLNIMAQDHVRKHKLQPLEPFEDIKEAVAFMTQDRPSGPRILTDEELAPKTGKTES